MIVLSIKEITKVIIKIKTDVIITIIFVTPIAKMLLLSTEVGLSFHFDVHCARDIIQADS